MSDTPESMTNLDTLAWFAKKGATFCKVSAHTSTDDSPGKNPNVGGGGWQNRPLDLATVTPWLKRGNVGLLCGDHSGGLILLDVDKDAQAFLKQYPHLATVPAVIRTDAPDKIKIIVKIKDGAPGGVKFKNKGETSPFFEVLANGNQGVIAGTHVSGATLTLVNANNRIPVYTLAELDDLCYGWCGRGLVVDDSEPPTPETASIPQHERPNSPENGLLSAVESAWTPLEVFKHFDMVTTTRTEQRGEMVRLLGNGGLFVHKDGKRWCAAGQPGVGGGVFQAWVWASSDQATCKTPSGRAFYDLLVDMAKAANIDVSEYDHKKDETPQEPEWPDEWPPETEYTATPDTQPTPGAAATNQNAGADPWVIYTLADAYQEREPLEYIAGKVFALPSLNIVYGAPGTLKSFLLADLAVCTAAGVDWLPRAPHQGGGHGLATKQHTVLWLDFDNGVRRTHDRFASLGRGRGLPVSTPIRYASMPTPWLDASNKGNIGRLVIRCKDMDAKMIVIDNLGTVSGNVDENSGEMVGVMSLLRQLAEETGAAVVIIHHQRKSNGTPGGRAGDALRGHSSIEAALDLALQVERDDLSDTITVKATKTRGVDVLPFGALYTFADDDSGELHTAKFFGLETEDLKSGIAIETAIMNALYGTTLNKTDLANKVKNTLQGVGVNRIRERIDRMAAEKRLRVTPGKTTNEQMYTRL